MDAIILRYLAVIWHEVVRHRKWVALGVTAISFGILAIGMSWNQQYETAITIYADDQNVIKPLLEGQAAVTQPRGERARIVREIVFAPRLLEKVITSVFDDAADLDDVAMDERMAKLRDKVDISTPADRYIKISYRHSNPDVSYRVVNRLTNLFIEENAKSKRAESKNAYSFIDEQVKSYKAQLVEAEEKLKAFKSSNTDGLEADVSGAIARLRDAIDEIKIDIESQEIRVDSLEEQLESENRYARQDYKAEVYRDRLAGLEQRLDTMLLEYREQHPDVIDLKMQIQDLKSTIVEVESNKKSREELSGERNFNPVYEELSNKLSAAKVDLEAMRYRLRANEKRLEEQYKRRARVANNQATLSELTRDYDVTKQIYENLLERKERARISMTLDLAGQGLTYKVLEPAVYPVQPVGLQFVHFATVGPIFGLLGPLGAIIALIFLDPKIRLAEELDKRYPGIVLAVVPNKPASARVIRNMALFAGAFAVLYSGAAISYQQLVFPA